MIRKDGPCERCGEREVAEVRHTELTIAEYARQNEVIANLRQQLATAERTIAELREKLEKSQAAYETEWSQNEVLRTRAESAELTNQQLAEKCLRLVAENDLLRARTADQITNRGG